MERKRDAQQPVTVDGQPITVPDMDAALAAIAWHARRDRGFAVFTLNLDHLVKRRADARFAAAYAEAEVVSADGWPVVWLARRKGARPMRRTTGADMIKPVCRLCAECDWPVAMIGSTGAVLHTAAARLQSETPGLRVALLHAPPFGFDPDDAREVARLADMVRDSGARIVFLALGAPKQELLAARLKEAGVAAGFLCIGAGLDFIAGHQKRAPVLAQRLGVEWLWRLLHQPRRLLARYVAGGALFMRLIFQEGQR